MCGRKFVIPSSVARKYVAFMKQLGKNSGMEIQVAEARLDLIQRLSLIVTPLMINDQYVVYCDTDVHPSKFFYNLVVRGSKLMLVDFQLFNGGVESIKISDHAWIRFFQRLAEVGIMPLDEEEARKELARCLMRGSWREEEASEAHVKTFHCVDKTSDWGELHFKLVHDTHDVEDVDALSRKLKVVTFHFVGAREASKHPDKKGGEERGVLAEGPCFINEPPEPDQRRYQTFVAVHHKHERDYSRKHKPRHGRNGRLR